MKNYIYILFIFCIAFSCNKKNGNNSDIIKINIDMKSSKERPIETFFSSIEVVILETTENSLLKNCGKIIVHNDKYYIFDDGLHAIFIFDKQGRFIKNSMHKEGAGPGEYGTIIDFDLNPQTGWIEILDISSYKIRRYDDNFNFINEITLPSVLYPVNTFKIATSDLYVFYSSHDEEHTEALQFYSISKNKVVKRFNIQSAKHNLPSTQKYSFYTRDSTLFFTNRYPNNHIFEICYNKRKIRTSVEFSFGDNTFQITKASEKSLEDKSFMEMNSDRFVFPQTKYENDSCYFSFVEFKNNLHLVSYNKISTQVDVFPCKFAGGGMVLPPKFIDNTYFYVLAEPDWIKYMIKETLLDKRSQEAIKTVQEDDNPVLLKYNLKYD